MARDTWDNRYQAWFNWYNSSAGPYFNGGGGNSAYDYFIKNYTYASNPSYNHDASVMLTLSEGQALGMLYALLADNVKAFNESYKVLVNYHKLSRTNIINSKSAVLDGSAAWPSEYPDFVTQQGVFILEDKGANASLNTFGGVWSANFNPGSSAVLPGLATIYMNTDADVLIAACLLLGYERWNMSPYRDSALNILTDLAKYGTSMAGGRYALSPGQYQGIDGFHLPSPITLVLGGGLVNPGADQVTFDTTDFTDGDAVRLFLTDGSTAPGGLNTQDGVGAVWPKYYLGVINSTTGSFYPTKADAIANTNIVNITDTGAGSLIIYPYEEQAGQVSTNPSFMFPPFFTLFAKYDMANNVIWNGLAATAYSDILASCAENYWNMPTFLTGVDIASGANAPFRSGGDYTEHNLDAIRVAINMAFDGSTNALTVLKNQCVFNNISGKWEPKTGKTGGIWRFYLDTGMIPSTLEGIPDIYQFVDADVDTGNNRINLHQDWVADAGSFTNPIQIVGVYLTTTTGDPLLFTDSSPWELGMVPAPLSNGVAVYPRKYSGTVYTLHASRGEALSGANAIDLTTVGSGLREWLLGYQCTLDISTDTFTLINDSGAFRTGEDIHIIPGGGTAATGVSSSTTYYGRMVLHNQFTVHPTLADANANTNRINATALGTGEIVLAKSSPAIGWFRRPSISANTELSPFGVAQIMAYKYVLNGYVDAEAFYDSLPAWVAQGGDGSFAEGNGDYVVQHGLGWLSGIMSDRARAHTHGRGYIVFGSTQLSSATTLQNALTSALEVAIYATVLRDVVSGQYAVPVVGVKAFDALTPTQQANLVKQLPTGQWRANL